jgi:hypothetical protein
MDSLSGVQISAPTLSWIGMNVMPVSTASTEQPPAA